MRQNFYRLFSDCFNGLTVFVWLSLLAHSFIVAAQQTEPTPIELSVRELKLDNCIRLFGSDRSYVLNDEAAFLSAIRKDVSRARCVEQLQNKINFQTETLLGVNLDSGYCRAPLGLNFRVTNDVARKRYLFSVGYLKPQGVCRALSSYDVWLVAPKLPANYQVELEIKPQPRNSPATLPATAQDDSAPNYTEPLGIALETVEYPYPVKYLTLEIKKQSVRMAYMDVAPTGATPNGQTVVLLHGKNFSGDYWAGVIASLTAAGYRVVVPDQIGFGKSSKPDIAYSFDLLAANTAQLLDTLNIARVAIVGHSMGGMLAVRFTRNYPERTTQLVLANPIGLEDYRFSIPPQTLQTLYQSELNQTDATKIRAFYRRYVVEWKPELYERFVATRVRLTLGGEYPRWARASALTYQMIYQQPVRHEFGLIKTPTLLIIGQADRTVVGGDYAPPEIRKTLGQYPALGKAAARDIPQSKLVEMPNVGHIPHLEAPERFTRELLSFLNQRTP